MPMVAWYMLSKESYMKRVIREVLPTRRWDDGLVSRMDRAEMSGRGAGGEENMYRFVRLGTLIWVGLLVWGLFVEAWGE